MGEETDIQSDIMAYLKARGFFVWRNPTQGLRIAGGTRTRNPNSGAPDIMAVKDGQFYGIEVKRPRGKISPKQIEWANEAMKKGAIMILAKSVQEVIDKLLEI